MWCAPVLCRHDAVATEKPVGCYARIAPPDFACGTHYGNVGFFDEPREFGEPEFSE